MGGWYSSTSNTEDQRTQAAANYPTKSRTWFDARSTEANNNDNHVVIIPMDMSQHAEGAFECKYFIFIPVRTFICLVPTHTHTHTHTHTATSAILR